MVFWCHEKENFLLQHCSSSQDTHVGIIWAHYHKLYHDSSHSIGRLTWNSLNLEHDCSFWELFFENIYIISSLIFLIVTISYNMTPREGFTLFRSFLNFLCLFHTMVKAAGKKILGSELNFATLAVDLWWNSIFWTQIWFFQKNNEY